MQKNLQPDYLRVVLILILNGVFVIATVGLIHMTLPYMKSGQLEKQGLMIIDMMASTLYMCVALCLQHGRSFTNIDLHVWNLVDGCRIKLPEVDDVSSSYNYAFKSSNL